MSRHLKMSESPGAAIRRVCRRHLNKALASLEQGNQPESIHAARREIKQLRAVFRFARGDMSRGHYRRMAEAMRLAAKPFGPARDARVTLKALEIAAGKKAPQRFPQAHAALTGNFQQEQRRFQANDSAAVGKHILQTLRRQFEDATIKGAGWKTLQPGLKKSCRRTREAADRARLAPTTSHLHEWRKQAKKFWYQLDFLCPQWPPTTKALVAGLERLGDLLGDDHDLVMLKQFIADHVPKPGEADRLNQAVDKRRRQLAAKIQTLGRRLFAPPPKTICRQIKKDWNKWRRKN